MELYQLKTFVTVAEEGHLTRAAERLFISQPSVSAHVRALEDELGLALFRRTPKGMVLTSEGRTLLDHARKTLDAAGGLVMKAKALQTEVSGVLRLGLNTDPSFVRVVDLVSLLEERHPMLELQLVQDTTGRIIADVRSGDLDAGFVFGDHAGNDIQLFTYRHTAMVVVAPTNYQEQLEHASWQEMATLPWIISDEGCPCHDMLRDMFSDHGLNPAKIMEADHEELLRVLVMAGKGLCLMREDEAQHYAAQQSLIIWQRERLPLKASVAHLASRAEDTTLRALHTALQDIWQPGKEQATAEPPQNVPVEANRG